MNPEGSYAERLPLNLSCDNTNPVVPKLSRQNRPHDPLARQSTYIADHIRQLHIHLGEHFLHPLDAGRRSVHMLCPLPPVRLQPVRQTMQVRHEAFEPADWFWILVRTHGHVMGAVPYVNPSGSGMHYQARSSRGPKEP
jgi:hypothetical protein